MSRQRSPDLLTGDETEDIPISPIMEKHNDQFFIGHGAISHKGDSEDFNEKTHTLATDQEDMIILGDELVSKSPVKSGATTAIEEVDVETPLTAESGTQSPAIYEEEEASGELRQILTQFSGPPSPTTSHISNPMSPVMDRKPTPELEQPFDFNRFQEQLRAKSAEPVAKYMKSFLHEFGKKQWSCTEQQKIIHDFLEFIREKMLLYEPWASASEQEFDNATEGMEKLIMNRLYPHLFPPLLLVTLGKSGIVRTGHSEDIDRDRILAEKIQIYAWLQPRHLEIPEGPLNERFLHLASVEINKIGGYRAPRDKIICILNCCKVIFGLLRHAGTDESADKFMPLLILTLIRASVPNLISHASFIIRFRTPVKLGGEAGYYLSSLQGAIDFVENMDRSTLTIEETEYEKQVETGVKKLKARRSGMPPSPQTPIAPTAPLVPSGPPRSGLTLPTRGVVLEKGGTALKTIAKPLSQIGRLFSHDDRDLPDLVDGGQRPPLPQRPGSAYAIPSGAGSSLNPSAVIASFSRNREEEWGPELRARPQIILPGESALRLNSNSTPTPSRIVTPTTPIQLRSAIPNEAMGDPVYQERMLREEADRERAETLTTLSAMFENVQLEVIEMVLDEKRGKVGGAIDALLEISSGAS